MENIFLSNFVAQLDLQDIKERLIINDILPFPIFTVDQLTGVHECIHVEQDVLAYVAASEIEDCEVFSNALLDYANNGYELFFEATYKDFASAFPLAAAPEVLKLGLQILPGADGFRFQTLTLLDDGTVLHEPYYMFLPTASIRSARTKQSSEEFSQHIYSSMELEYPAVAPEEGSRLARQIESAMPISATLATISISLLAFKCRYEAQSDFRLPVIQDVPRKPRILRLSLS